MCVTEKYCNGRKNIGHRRCIGLTDPELQVLGGRDGLRSMKKETMWGKYHRQLTKRFCGAHTGGSCNTVQMFKDTHPSQWTEIKKICDKGLTYSKLINVEDAILNSKMTFTFVSLLPQVSTTQEQATYMGINSITQHTPKQNTV